MSAGELQEEAEGYQRPPAVTRSILESIRKVDRS